MIGLGGSKDILFGSIKVRQLDEWGFTAIACLESYAGDLPHATELERHSHPRRSVLPNLGRCERRACTSAIILA